MSKAPVIILKGEIKVSLEPAGPQLPSAQNNPCAKVTHDAKWRTLGRTVLNLFMQLKIKFE